MLHFSVVIPLYNKAGFIEQTLKSVLDQSYQEFEVIIIDDGSTDSSVEKVRSFKDERIKLFQQENKGASEARNKGVQLSSYEWIAFLDADDIWYGNHLKELKKCIDTFPEVNVVSNAYEIALENDFIKKPQFSLPIPNQSFTIDDYFKYSLIDPLFWTSSIAVKKAAFDSIGGFDVNISSGQDTDLICRLALNYRLAFNPKKTFLHLKHTENNLSKSNYLDSRIKIIEKLKPEESHNHNLKKYLDINRFSLALQAKIRKRKKMYRTLKTQIDLKNLSSKQKFLLNCPAWTLVLLKKVQKLLIKSGVYKSAFN